MMFGTLLTAPPLSLLTMPAEATHSVEEPPPSRLMASDMPRSSARLTMFSIEKPVAPSIRPSITTI